MRSAGSSGGAARIRKLGDNLYEVEAPDGTRIVVRLDGDVVITDHGSYYLPDLLAEADSRSPRSPAEPGGGWLAEFDGGTLRAAVSLKVVELYVSEGSRVRRGDKLACVETMKMLEHLTAPCDGVVERVYARPGAGVVKGEPLIRLRCER